MTAAETILVLVFAVVTLVGIYWVRHRKQATHVEAVVAHEVRQKSHEVKNQVTAVRGGLNRIKNSRDPLLSLVRVIQNDGSLDDA